MFDAGRRPMGRLFYWTLVMMAVFGLERGASGIAPQSQPTTTTVAEQIESGGALELQHGDVSFSGASQGIIGGLYSGAVTTGSCLAGFQVMPNGASRGHRRRTRRCRFWNLRCR